MNLIENVECFKNCTKLCKPHESNKAIWEIHEKQKNMNAKERQEYEKELSQQKDEVIKVIKHAEFI